MKIEKLEFENINSLKGHYTIDFTHPELAGDGIFVITGPTGAGKTTLLDAISFALYAETPRQDGVSKTCNELMSRGTDSCMAGVTFSHGGKRYTVTTSQQRTRRGSRDPFANCKRTFEEHDEAGRAVTTANQLRDVARKVQDCTGLDFANFKRCMMLAQGEFASFMKAGEKDRAEVLTTITGTEIYEQIGQELHNVWDAKKRELDSMTPEPTLPQEERLALEESRKELDTRRQRTSALLQELRDLVTWLDDCTRTAQGLQQATAEQARTAAELAAFRADGSQARLDSATRATGARPAHTALVLKRQESAAAEHLIRQEQENLRELEPARKEAEELLTAAKNRQETETPALEQLLERIDTELRPLEQQISVATRAAEDTRRLANDAAAQADAARRAAVCAGNKHKAAERALAEAKTRLADATADAELGSHLAAVKLCLENWQHVATKGAELPPTQAIRDRVAELHSLRETLLGGNTPEHLHKLAAAWDFYQERSEDLARAEQAEQAAKAALETLKQKELPDVDAARETADKRGLICTTIRMRANIQTQLDALYKDFAEGRLDCCPCCGATTPGKCRPTHVDEELAAAEKAWKEARAELAKAKKLRDSHADALETARQGREAASAALAKLRTEFALHTAVLGEATAAKDPAKEAAKAHKAIARLEKLDNDSGILEKVLPAAEKRDELHSVLRGFCRELPQSLPAARTLAKDLERRAKAYETAAKAVTDGETALAALQATATEKETAAKAAADEAGKKETAAKRDAETLASLTESLRNTWGTESADTRTRATRSKISMLETACTKAKDALTQADQKVREHKAMLRTAQDRHRTGKEALAAAERDFAAALEKAGFADETAYLEAEGHIREHAQLQDRLRDLEQAAVAARKTVEERTAQLTELRSRHECSDSREELLEKHRDAAAEDAAAGHALVEVLARLKQDDDTLARNADLLARRAACEQDFRYWDLLHEVLGGSKEGFKRYAQQITFQNLLICANERLHLLTDRYSLLQTPDGKLGLLVVDHWQDEEKPRAASNLSGGESFIVSLALALGLAQMAGSETQLDTLFLDEGFGTLDGDQLEKVLDSLERLRAGGKLIGLITHVDQLKERITCNLSICPGGTSGFSTIDSHPAVTRGTEVTKRA